MAREPAEAIVPSTSTATSSSNAGASYVGSFISLISKSEIRYEGVLYYLNVQDSTIGLNSVRSYGTEGRKKDGPQILPGEKVYEYILFRGSDIKDLQIKASPPAQMKEQIHNDPAIIQSHYTGMHLNSSPFSSIGVKSFTESTQGQDSPALKRRGDPGAPTSHQPVALVGPLDLLPSTQIARNQSSSTQMYVQGDNGTPLSIFNAPQHPISFQSLAAGSFPLTMQGLSQAPEIQASTTLSPLIPSEFGNPISSSIPSASVHLNVPPFLTPVQCSASLDISSSLFTKSSWPYPASTTANRSTPTSFSSSSTDINTSEAQLVGKSVFDPRSVLPVQATPCPASSFVDSSIPLLAPPPSFLIPDQLTQTRPQAFSSIQKLYPDKSDFNAQTVMSSNSGAALLPLPTTAQQSQYSAMQFTEEFDFNAMNEKFKKDEVWGYLGKEKYKAEIVQDFATGQSLGDREGHDLVPNRKPAYSKDEFFDTISCNSLTRGARNAQNRFSERIKMDTETFGNAQHRPNLGYGSHAAGRGEYHRASYNWGRGYSYGGRGYGYGGRGYGYGGRGHIGNMPF